MPKIYPSAVVPVPIEDVWSNLRNFDRVVEIFDYVDDGPCLDAYIPSVEALSASSMFLTAHLRTSSRN